MDGIGADPRAERRTVRLMLAASGFTSLVAVLFGARIGAAADVIPMTPWSYALVVLGHLVPVGAALLALGLPLPRIRVLARLMVAGQLVSTLAVVLVLIVVPDTQGALPWLVREYSPVVVGALIAWGARPAWLALGAMLVATQALAAVVGDFSLGRYADDAQTLIIQVAVLVLFGALIDGARALDASTTAARAAELGLTITEARRAAGERAQTVVHDDVLATLLLAARGAGGLAERVRAQATAALASIRSLAAAPPAEPVRAGELVRGLRDAVAREGEDADIRVQLLDAHALVPGAVAEAIVAAFRQGYVNSLVHARRAARRVDARVATDRIVVTLIDNGPGLDPADFAALTEGRLGISAGIVGRMRRVPGGDAWIESIPGAGTRVVLAWTRPGAAEGGERPPLPPAPEAIPIGRSELVVPSAVFLGAEALLAAIVATFTGRPLVPLLAVAGLVAAFLAMGWRRLIRPSRGRMLATLVICLAVSGLSWLPSPSGDLQAGSGWVLMGTALILATAALRGHRLAGVLGLLATAALSGLGAALQGFPTLAILTMLVRPTVGGLLAILVGTVIVRQQRRVAELHVAELAALREQAWQEAEHAELEARARQIDAMCGALLERIAADRELDEAGRAECRVVEGRLRDLYRAPRLSRQPLVDVAAAARRRGVDVVLLDDAAELQLDDLDLDAISAWMAAQLVGVGEGRFTGRILPAGRGGLASAVHGAESVVLER